MSVNYRENGKDRQEIQDRLAENGGLAIVIADENSPELAASNNNSMCRVLYNSDEFAPECGKFCGTAYERAIEAGETVEYKCYAGLNCLAVPIKNDEKQLVAIVGRTFLKAEDYRLATARAISGDWRKFPPTKFFENILISGSSENLKATAKKIENLDADEKNELWQAVEKTPETASISESVSEKFTRRNTEEVREISEWRSLLGSLLKLNYGQACEVILKFIARRYGISALGWVERHGNRLEMVLSSEQLQARQIRLDLLFDNEQLLDAANRKTALEMRERQAPDAISEPQTIQLFPVTLGGEIRSVLVVGDPVADEREKQHIARFCRTIASQLEILRLREELSRRARVERAVQKFNENIKEIDTEDFWASLARILAGLMRAERVSLLIYNEPKDSLTVEAATGAQADDIKRETVNLGEKIARQVLQSGEPLIVEDVRTTEIADAPDERGYKSNSFVSYPIVIGRRKIGVVNITDRADGKSFDEFDLACLRAIMPQLAVLVDRALLKYKAGEFEQLSVTDALTGLLNRPYLDKRLPEEIKRSNREGFPMSFMMIDVDDFKSYNDNFGHPEGDAALKIVAQCLQETLRGADVAVRYGGEEFSILLPQTTAAEAAIIGERVREKVASTRFPKRQVTISVGIASCADAACTAPEIVKHADDALYSAKHRGRNNVQSYEELERL